MWVARNVDHLRCCFLQNKGTLNEETHLQPAACSEFHLLLQVHSRRSSACPSCAVSFKTLHAHSFPSQLSPTFFKDQSYHRQPPPPWSLLFPSSSILPSDLHHPGCCRRKCQQLQKPAADAALDFSAMFSMRTWIVCVIVGVIWYFCSCKAALTLQQTWAHWRNCTVCLQNVVERKAKC